MVDNTGKINFKLTQGMSKSECKTSQEEELFSVFDFNQNDKIDDNELQIFQKNFGKKGIKENEIEQYLQYLKDSPTENTPVFQYLNTLTKNPKEVLSNIEEIQHILTKDNPSFMLGKYKHYDANDNSLDLYTNSNYNNFQKRCGLVFLGNEIDIYFSNWVKIGNGFIKCDKDKIYKCSDGNFYNATGDFKKLKGANTSNGIAHDLKQALNNNKATTIDKGIFNNICRHNIVDVFQVFNKNNKHSLIEKLFEKLNSTKNIQSFESNLNDIKKLVDMLIESKKKSTPEIKSFIDNTFKHIEVSNKNEQSALYQKRIIDFVDLLLKDRLPSPACFAKIDENNISKQIDNPYYKGAEYDVKIDGDIIKITNKDTNEIVEIDLDKLVEKLPFTKQLAMKQVLAKLPAEVLVDLYHEATLVEHNEFFKKDINSDAIGVFTLLDDDMAFRSIDVYNTENLTHELGHALDNTRTGNLSWGQHSFEENTNYKETFEKELDEYIAKGEKQYDGNDRSIYCTENIYEMFAECYPLLMLGDCQSKETILKYFPKTRENVKQHIEYIRSLPQEIRHKK